MGMARWRAEVVVVTGARGAAWAARLLTQQDQVAWHAAERWADPARAATAALVAVRQAARAHRVQLLAIQGTPGPWWPPDVVRVPDLAATARLAHGLVAPPPVRLAACAPDRVIAHGHADYVVDLRRRTCTCPAFRYRRGPCKHLQAALAIGLHPLPEGDDRGQLRAGTHPPGGNPPEARGVAD